MADQNNGDSDKKLRADPMNLTDVKNIETLICENAGEIAVIIKRIMQAYIGENPMSEATRLLFERLRFNQRGGRVRPNRGNASRGQSPTVSRTNNARER